MPKLIFEPIEIENYIKEKTYHPFYKEAMEKAEQMCVHADGLFPARLLYERRPNEPLEVMEYRKKIFSAKTKPSFSKIFSTLQKIRRSSDWSIRYEGEFSKIREGETLEDYCEHYYPGFYSLTNWVFTLMLRKYLIDPNAVVFVNPLNRNDVEESDYLKPIAQIFDSKHVIDFVQDDYAVLVNPTGATYYLANNKPVKGKTFYFITTQQTLRYDQQDGKMRFALVDQYDHNLGYLPCFKLKGIVTEQVENVYLYESKIAGIIPEFDEAVREYSDLQAAKVLHIYPERWEFTQNECRACNGKGITTDPTWFEGCGRVNSIACDTCKGTGYIVAGPYSKILVRPTQNAALEGISGIPTPPAGYIEKDVEIVKVMEESIKGHIYDGLASLSFEFLAERPLAQSGISKAFDGDEMNNTVHGIAEDLVAAMDNIYWLIALYRYGLQYPADEIVDMVPDVNVPEKYDILSTTHTLEELVAAKVNDVNPVIKSALETAFATARFYTEPEVRDRLVLILTLDPLPNISEDEKMSRLTNDGITLESYVVSSNIQAFVRRALQEEKGFVDMELEKQIEILNGYAQEIIAANAAKMLPTPDTGLDEFGKPIETDDDNTGKIPLAVQQLSLAATRAREAGDTALAASITAKINQLLGKLIDAPVNA